MSGTGEIITVAVVDDHLMVAEMLSLVITSQPDMHMVGVASGVVEALALIASDSRVDSVRWRLLIKW